MTEAILATELVRDFTVYPRDKIISQNITDMVGALESGKVLPPILGEKNTLRIIDGFHRLEAHIRFHGEKELIDVQFEEHDDAGLFLRAIETNASHGVNLSKFDKIKCVQKGEAFGISKDFLASAMNMTREKLEGTIERKTSGEGVVLKRTVGHFAGKQMTQQQKAFNQKAGGMDQKYYIDQVTSLLESNSINWDNENVVEAIESLRKALDNVLAVNA